MAKFPFCYFSPELQGSLRKGKEEITTAIKLQNLRIWVSESALCEGGSPQAGAL